MGKVIEVNFGNKVTSPCSAPEPYSEPPTHTVELSMNEDGEVKVSYVRVPAKFFYAMLETMQFYGKQGFDHGQRAREVLNWRLDK